MTILLIKVVVICGIIIPALGKPRINSETSDDEIINEFEDTETLNNDEYYTNNEDKDDGLDPIERQTITEVFLHNFISKLERTVRLLKDKTIEKQYDKLSAEFEKRLAQDTVNTAGGFAMGDQALRMLRLANYVLDRADIREVKKKKAFERELKKSNEPRRKIGLKGMGDYERRNNMEDESSNVQRRIGLKGMGNYERRNSMDEQSDDESTLSDEENPEEDFKQMRDEIEKARANVSKFTDFTNAMRTLWKQNDSDNE